MAAQDATSTGPEAVPNTFLFGNDPPVVTNIAVDDDGTGGISSNAIVRFVVSDSSGDPVSITRFQFSPTGASQDAVLATMAAGPGTDFPSGSLDGLSASPAGDSHSLTWNSTRLAPNDDAQARIWITVADSYAESASASSPALTIKKRQDAASSERGRLAERLRSR